MADQDRTPVTLTCPEPTCDKGPNGGPWQITAPAQGSGSAGWKLGTHRSRAHGYRSPGRVGRPPKQAPGRGDPAGTGLVDVVRDSVAEISDKSTKPPTTDELTKALTRFVGTISTAEASYLAETDPTIQSEEDRDALVEYLRLSASDAREVAYPFARVVGRSKLNARYGRAIVDNVDAGSAAAAVFQLAVRHRRYFRERRRREVELGLRGPAQLTAPIPSAAAPAPYVPAAGPAPGEGFAPPGGTTAPGEMRGIVASGPPPEVIDALARANGHGSPSEVPRGT